MELAETKEPQSLAQKLSLETNVGDRERWVSGMTGGALLALGLIRTNWTARPLGLLGGMMLLRSVTGHCSVYKQLGVSSADGGHHITPPGGLLNREVKVQKTVTIKASPDTLYAFWRDFSNLPRFTQNLKSVHEDEQGTSHWVAYGPGQSEIKWTAKVHEDTPGQRLSWSTLPESDISHNGSVTFTAGPRGTEVRVVLRYGIPGGKLGQALAKMLGNEPGQQINADLRRLKQVMEVGEIARTDGQSAGAGRDTTGQMSTNDSFLNF